MAIPRATYQESGCEWPSAPNNDVIKLVVGRGMKLALGGRGWGFAGRRFP